MDYALRLPAHCVRGRLSALPSAPASAGMTREKTVMTIEKKMGNDKREKLGMTQKKAENDNTQKVCDNVPMGDILSALLTT